MGKGKGDSYEGCGLRCSDGVGASSSTTSDRPTPCQSVEGRKGRFVISSRVSGPTSEGASLGPAKPDSTSALNQDPILCLAPTICPISSPATAGQAVPSEREEGKEAGLIGRQAGERASWRSSPDASRASRKTVPSEPLSDPARVSSGDSQDSSRLQSQEDQRPVAMKRRPMMAGTVGLCVTLRAFVTSGGPPIDFLGPPNPPNIYAGTSLESRQKEEMCAQGGMNK